MNPHAAYLVAFVDDLQAIAEIGVYSEPRPTCSTKLTPVVIVFFKGRTYHEASDDLRSWVRANFATLRRTLPLGDRKRWTAFHGEDA